MLLRKIDGEMNVQNCGFSAKLQNGDSATCSTTDGNDSYHGRTPLFFEEMTRCRRQKHCRRRPDNPNGPSKFRKYRVYLRHLRLCDRDCCSAADDSGSCHAPAPSYFEEMTHCRLQKLTGDDQATLTVDRNSAI